MWGRQNGYEHAYWHIFIRVCSREPCIGIHDPIQAKILAIGEQTADMMIISLDLVAIDADYVSALRAKIQKRHNVPADKIMVHATHTQSGPGGTIQETTIIWKAFKHWMLYDQELVFNQHVKILQAIGDTIIRWSPVRCSTAQARWTASLPIGSRRRENIVPIYRCVTNAVYNSITDDVYSYRASNLNVGSNPIHILVTAQDGTTRIPYVLKGNRAQASSDPGPSTTPTPSNDKVTSTDGKLTLPACKIEN